MNESPVGSTTRPCPRCNAENPSDARFCGSCGAIIHGSPPSSAPAPTSGVGTAAYAPSRPAIDFQQFSAIGGRGTPLMTSMGAAEAYDLVMGRVRRDDVEIEWEQPPSSARFIAYYKDFWNTGGTRLKYSGELTVQEVSPGVSSLRLGLTLNWGSAVPLFAGAVILGIMFALANFMLAPYMLLFIMVLLVIQIWQYNSKFPTKLMDRWKQGLPRISGVVGGTMPGQGTSPAAASPRPTTSPQPAAVAPLETKPSLAERLKQLHELKEAGAITQDDYDAKKAEILKQL